MLALGLGAIPALALAQSPFRDYRQAAGDQYDTTTTTTPGPGLTVGVTVTTPVITGTVGVTASGAPTDTTGDQGQTKPDTASGGQNPSSANPGTSNGVAPAGTAGAANPLLQLIRQRYAVIGLSPLLEPVLPDVVEALGKAAYAADITEPLKVDTLKKLTENTKWAGAESDNTKLRAFAKALGKSVPNKGKLAQKAFPKLAKFPNLPDTITLQQFDKVAGIVLTHQKVDLTGAEDKRRDAFIRGFVKGLKSVKIETVDGGMMSLPIVGVEERNTDGTAIPFFKNLGISTVDDTDVSQGKLSLERVMDGAKGHFGTKKTADSGKVAKSVDGPKPLLFRPTGNYSPGELLRDPEGGLPGGGATFGVLLLLGVVGTFSFLTIVERRTRRMRRARA